MVQVENKLLTRWTLINACLILRKDKIPYNIYRNLRKKMDNLHTKILNRNLSIPERADDLNKLLTEISDIAHGRTH